MTVAVAAAGVTALVVTALLVRGDAAPAAGAGGRDGGGGDPPPEFVRSNRLANRTIPCSEEDRVCFLEKMVRYPPDGRCYPLRQRGPCGAHQWLVVDAAEALRGGGRVVGACADDARYACPPLRVPMAHGGCALEALACGRRGGAWRLAFDVFGEGECASREDAADAPLPSVAADRACKVPPSDPETLHLYALYVASRVACVRNDRDECVPEVQLPSPQPYF